jgi:hypothetical protein
VKRTRGVLGIAARCVECMAPWIYVFAVSASLAYAMILAVGGGPSAQEGDRGVYAGVASAQVSVTTALVYDEADGTACETGACARIRRFGPPTGGNCESLSVGQQYVGLNTWILGEAITSCTH